MYTEPKVPGVANTPGEVRPSLDSYETANEKNRVAIQQAQAHNKRLQKIYNKKPDKKVKDEEPKWPKWTWPKFTNPFASK